MSILKKPEWILRVGVFGTFLGHGIFALQVKQSWLPFFTAVGISESNALILLPLIGMLDVTIALFALIRPLKAVLLWAVFWGLVTALIRPVSGKSIWDFVERSSNWAAPLALLAFHGFPKNWRDFFRV